MGIEELKRWHWIVLGLLLGLAIGGMRVLWGPDYRDSTARTLSQEIFEGALLRAESPLRLSDVVLHPRDEDGDWWITGRFVDEKSMPGEGGDNAPRVLMRVQGEFKYRGTEPYKPKLWLRGMSSGETTIREYLDAVAARLPAGRVDYRYAWDEEKWAVMVIWTGGTGLVVGGLWPTLLSILIGAGWGVRRKEEPAYDLERFGKEPETAPAVEARPEEQERLTAMMAELERELQAEERGPMAVEAASAGEPVRRLCGEAAEAPVTKPEEEKEYAGEFYPTAAHSQKPEE